MDIAEIYRWFRGLDNRLPLTDRERAAVTVLTQNESIMETLAVEFVHMSELRVWLEHDRTRFQQQREMLQRVLSFGSEADESLQQRLAVLDQLEEAGISTRSLGEMAQSFRALLHRSQGHADRVVTPNGRYFHRTDCKWLDDLPEQLLSPITHDEAAQSGYRPCGTCRA